MKNKKKSKNEMKKVAAGGAEEKVIVCADFLFSFPLCRPFKKN